MKNGEEKQLKRLYKARDQKSYSGYFIIVTLIIILTRVTNELSTNLSTYVQSSVVTEFFVNNGYTYEQGLSLFTSISMAIGACAILSIFYKTLADKLGRKVLLVINAIGLSIGMALCYLSVNLVCYVAGVAFMMFFTQNDLQMVYILETAPKGRATTYFSVIKAFGILGMVLVPILRDTIMANTPTLWRNVYLVPVIICLVIALGTALLMRESKIFVNNRIAYLETPVENRKKEKKNEGGLGRAIKYILKHKEMLMPVLAYMFFGMCSMATYTYVESVMTTNGLTAANVTQALYVYPFVYAALTFIAGFVGDKFGRKAVVVPCGFLVVIGYVLFIIACIKGWSPYLIGFLNGIYLGSYFIASEFTGVMLMEKAPTSLRASITGASYILMMGGCIIGIAQMMILMVKVSLNFAALSTILPYMLIGTFIVIFKVKETKGTDLRQNDCLETANENKEQSDKGE